MWFRNKLDIPLLLLIVLFLLTFSSFLTGILPYPLGFFVLLAFIIARLFYLQDRT
jgi:hypothetical protein